MHYKLKHLNRNQNDKLFVPPTTTAEYNYYTGTSRPGDLTFYIIANDFYSKVRLYDNPADIAYAPHKLCVDYKGKMLYAPLEESNATSEANSSFKLRSTKMKIRIGSKDYRLMCRRKPSVNEALRITAYTMGGAQWDANTIENRTDSNHSNQYSYKNICFFIHSDTTDELFSPSDFDEGVNATVSAQFFFSGYDNGYFFNFNNTLINSNIGNGSLRTVIFDLKKASSTISSLPFSYNVFGCESTNGSSASVLVTIYKGLIGVKNVPITLTSIPIKSKQ